MIHADYRVGLFFFKTFFVELYNVLVFGSCVDKEPPLIILIYTHLPSSLFPAVKIKDVI